MKTALAFILFLAIFSSSNVYPNIQNTTSLPTPPPGYKWVKIESLSDEFNAGKPLMG